MNYYFRCIENLKAPAMTITTDWEAAEMRRHPSYEEVDEKGNVIGRPSGSVKVEIPFAPEPTKRATLKLPNTASAK